MKSIGAVLLLLASCISIHCAWVDEMENPGMFEGDIQLDPDEKEGILKTGNAFASIKGGRWPGGRITYQIDSSIGSRGVSAINNAIANYHRYTCLKFTKVSRGAGIEFYRGSGCSSPVGYRSGRQNRISLASGCWYKGTVMHEIGHSMREHFFLGIYHEQSRPDRDNYVQIIWSNIPQNRQFNFRKQSYNIIDRNIRTPYDYGSMMHYGAKAFGNGKTTIRTLNSASIGQRNGFSQIDIKQINLMYCS
ncbi:zinc metalloproteinase nas-4-like [Hydractinia symbiolongicarpus]|uniref:zinc metalloproteinase nas-4-like n=1 Tax=Hydractinia symbiolongicarpus TaxID=13093 RepID=UPI00254BCE10|nr:zinc metalloproteinase nas-4-like [Hydractinia symbiolongicarpus]